MKINDIINEDEKGWFKSAFDKVMHGFGDGFQDYVKEAQKVLHRLGSQGTIRHLQKEFPKADLIDLRRAVKQALTLRQDR